MAANLDDIVAETGPGFPDEAVGKGQLPPEAFAAAEAELWAQRLRERGWTGVCGHADDSEAHPS